MSLFRAIVNIAADRSAMHWVAYVLLGIGILYGWFYSLVRSIYTETIKLRRALADMAFSATVMFVAGVIYTFAELPHTSGSRVFNASFTVSLWLAAFGVVLTVVPLGSAIRTYVLVRRAAAVAAEAQADSKQPTMTAA